jgi:hypothetical protein
VARVGHVRVDLVLLAGIFLECVKNIHDRGHGRCVCDPWGPG